MSDPVWLVLWCACALIGGGLEFIALVRRPEGDTLSENLRTWVRKRQWIRWLTLGVWATFSVWFARHIWLK